MRDNVCRLLQHQASRVCEKGVTCWWGRFPRPRGGREVLRRQTLTIWGRSGRGDTARQETRQKSFGKWKTHTNYLPETPEKDGSLALTDIVLINIKGNTINLLMGRDTNHTLFYTFLIKQSSISTNMWDKTRKHIWDFSKNIAEKW